MNWRRVVQSEKEYVDVYGSRVEEVLGKALTAAIEARTPVPEAFMADYLRGLPRRTTEVSTEDSEKPADTNKTVPRRLLRTPSMQAKDLGLDVRQKDSNNWFICHESMLSDPLFTALFKECGVPRKLRDQEKCTPHAAAASTLCDRRRPARPAQANEPRLRPRQGRTTRTATTRGCATNSTSSR